MKTKHNLSLAGILVISSLFLARAQDAPKRQMMMIHEDAVKPYMQEKYDATVKDLNAKIKEYGIDFTHYTLRTGDFTYLHVVPMENHAALDVNPFAELTEKLGEEATQKLFAGFDGCYDSHKDYIVYLEPQYSYQPEGADNTGKNWRRWIFWRPLPGKEAEVEEVLKGWVALYKSKGITQGYNVYSGGIGTDQPLYAYVFSAENALSYFTSDAKFWETAGEDGQAQWQKTRAITLKMWSKNGWYLEDLSYVPESAAAGN